MLSECQTDRQNKPKGIKAPWCVCCWYCSYSTAKGFGFTALTQGFLKALAARSGEQSKERWCRGQAVHHMSWRYMQCAQHYGDRTRVTGHGLAAVHGSYWNQQY